MSCTRRSFSGANALMSHAFVPNLRRGHHAITAERAVHDRVRAAFDELAACL